MPQILLRFFDEAGSEAASMDGLTQLVLRDPALSARILTVANSAAFRRSGEMRGIKQSLMALGTRMLRTIASCLVVQAAFRRFPGSEARDLAGFWRHSLLVAELARGTSAELGATDAEAEEAYLAGLLHDVGQLILLGGLGNAYGAILSRSEGELELSNMERAVLATDHGAVGAWLVDQWELPSLMADAILFHHLDADKVSGLDRLGRVLWAAHVASLPPQTASLIDLGVIETLLGISPERFGVLRDEAAQRVEGLAMALDIASAPAAQTVPLWSPEIHVEPIEGEVAEPNESGLRAAASAMAALQPLPRDLLTLDNEIDLLLSVRESARILFGVQRMAFFLLQPGNRTMAAVGIGGLPGSLKRLEIELRAGASLCADAALTRRSLTTFDLEPAQPVPPADQQIRRALDSEGLQYVPMTASGKLVGVMAFGVSPVQRTRLAARSAWLENFAGIVANNLESARLLRERERQIEAEVAGRYRLQGQRVAHEVNNPLAIIRNYLTLIASESPQQAAQGSNPDMDVLREEIDRLSVIVKQLSVDASTPAVPQGMVDLNQALLGMQTLYQESLFGAVGIQLELELPRQPTLAWADRDNVKQIVFNLWNNAAQALRRGDRVTTVVTPHVNQNGASYTEIRISDTGPGLPADVLQSLYSTPHTGTGTGTAPGRPPGRAGLGLSIVLALVERASGYITCRSVAGQGATFNVLLPESRRIDR